MAIIVPDPRWEEPNLLMPGKRPIGLVRIDWSNPLTDKMTIGYVGNTRHSLSDPPTSFTFFGDAKVENNYIVNPATGTSRVETERYSPSSLPCWGIFVGSVASNAVTTNLFQSSATTDYSGVAGQTTGAGLFSIRLGDGSGVTSFDRKSFTVGTTATNSKVFTVAFAIDSLTQGRIFMDGKEETVSVSGTASSYSSGGASSTGLISAGYSSGTNTPGNCTVHALFIFNKIGPPSSVLMMLSLEPYQFLIPA